MIERKHLVLVGGGHSQIEVLRQFGMHPMPAARLTMVARDYMAPYSGMLPGLIAGHYDYRDVHIDLLPLSRFAGCAFYQDSVVGLDLDNKRVLCAKRPAVSFDYVSINVGSTPSKSAVRGAREYALPVKPVDRFLEGWAQIRERVLDSRNGFKVLVVGGGAGGVELALSMQHRLEHELAKHGNGSRPEFHVAMETKEVLPTHNASVRRRVARALVRNRVHVHPESTAVEVHERGVVCADGTTLPYDALLWVTQASPAAWIRESGLATDEQGFILVDETLRSVSHPFVFAAGDVATMKNDPRPKSGVFAVRQGPYLARNLRNTVSGAPLEPFSPQKKFLSLISTGAKSAIASRGRWAMEGARIWRWKDRIDRKFMDKYADLPAMRSIGSGSTMPESAGEMEMHCGGCGCKVGSSILTSALARLKADAGADVVVGLEHPDDAAVVEIPEGTLAVHTVDFFKSFLDDPYVFGRVTANHCLSDIYAMGATPQTVLSIVTLPYGGAEETEETLYDLLAGTVSVLKECGASLVGGHTTEGSELTYGLSANGYVEKGGLLRKGGMQPGDRLILTKPLGTGLIFAADMRGKARGNWVGSAVDSMLVSNRSGARLVFEHGATACTDVTGFGLIGHLDEMLEQSGVGAELRLDALPLLDGAAAVSGLGIASTLYPQNARRASIVRNSGEAEDHAAYPVLFDPQTGGGLLASVPAEKADACLTALQDAGYAKATIVGEVVTLDGETKPVRLTH